VINLERDCYLVMLTRLLEMPFQNWGCLEDALNFFRLAGLVFLELILLGSLVLVVWLSSLGGGGIVDELVGCLLGFGACPPH